MKAIQIRPNVYWVGAKDWLVRDFHGYRTQRGSTYNAYLIIDEHITLVDTVKQPFAAEMLKRISSVVDPSKISKIICNHVEMDHSGAIPDILKYAPNAEVYISPVGEAAIKKHYFTDLNLKVVRTGNTISLGKTSISFLQIPFVHWPDSMVSYMPEEKLLFSNDAFGQHIAPDKIFFDEMPAEVIFEEAQKYYANIVCPYATQTSKAIEQIKLISPEIICPSHGVIWRSNINDLLSKYHSWTSAENDGGAVIIYDSMWLSTEKLANQILGFFEEKNISTKLFSLKTDHISDIMTHLLTAKYIAIGSPVLNFNVMPTVAGFLTYLKGLRPKNKTALIFGSYGWDSKVYKEIEETFKQLEWNMPLPPQLVKWVPSEEELQTMQEKLQVLLN